MNKKELLEETEAGMKTVKWTTHQFDQLILKSSKKDNFNILSEKYKNILSKKILNIYLQTLSDLISECFDDLKSKEEKLNPEFFSEVRNEAINNLIENLAIVKNYE